jgi:hypothetical protein
MDTQALGKTFEPTRTGGPAGAPSDWTVDDMVHSVRSTRTAPQQVRRWVAGLGVVVLAAAGAAAVVGSLDRGSAASMPLTWPPRPVMATLAKPAPLPSRMAAAAAAGGAPHAGGASSTAAGHRPETGRRSVVIVLPADRDIIAGSGIPVAGIALGRPHGPRVRSVHVELAVDGRIIADADIEVYAGRFAGVLHVDAPTEMTAAQLRFANPANPGSAATRTITIQAAGRP